MQNTNRKNTSRKIQSGKVYIRKCTPENTSRRSTTREILIGTYKFENGNRNNTSEKYISGYTILEIHLVKIQIRRERQFKHIGKYNRKMQIGYSKQKRQFESIQIGKYKSKKQKQVGKYKSAKVSRGNTSRRMQIKKILENTNLETQVGKQQFGTYTSENANRKMQIGKIQIGKYQSEN